RPAALRSGHRVRPLPAARGTRGAHVAGGRERRGVPGPRRLRRARRRPRRDRDDDVRGAPADGARGVAPMTRTLAAAVLLAFAARAGAGGPLVVATDGTPVGWSTAAPVPYVVDRGALGTLTNAAATALVDGMFGTWAAVPTTRIRFTRAGTTAVDVDATNFGPFLGPYGGATTPRGQNA